MLALRLIRKHYAYYGYCDLLALLVFTTSALRVRI